MHTQEPIFTEVKELCQTSISDINSLLCQLSASCPAMTEEALGELITAPQSHLFVLREGERTVGMLTLAFYPTPTGRKAWIEDVAVDADCRGRKYGKLMIEKAIDFVRQTGNTTLMLTSRPSRVAANALYQSAGFERKETNVYKMNV